MDSKNNKKILLVNSLDERYGSTYRARSMRAALSSLGLDCVYLESNYRAKDVGVVSVMQKDSLLGYLSASLTRSVILWRKDYQAVIIQKITPLTSLAIITALIKRKPLIVDWDDLDAEFQRTRFRKFLIQALEYLIAPFCKCVSTHSEQIVAYAKKRRVKRVFYLPQVIDTALFDLYGINPKEEKKRLGLEGKTVFGYIGTFTEGGMRDFEVILTFFKEGFASGEFFLLIVGGGPLQREVEDTIKTRYGLKNYLITGLLPESSIPGYIAAMDACLIYMRDNIGNRARVSLKLLEYLAMQKVVFGEVVGETKKMLGKYVSDFKELRAQGLGDLILRKQEGLIEARRTIEEKYSLKSMREALKQEEIIRRCR